MRNIDKRVKWFTLVELIVVIAIVAILSVTAFVTVTQWIWESEDSRIASDVWAIERAFNIHLSDQDTNFKFAWTFTWGNYYSLSGFNAELTDKLSSFDTLPTHPSQDDYVVAVNTGTNYVVAWQLNDDTWEVRSNAWCNETNITNDGNSHSDLIWTGSTCLSN